MWERISRIGADRKGPLMLAGDFNEMIGPSEKLGGAKRSEIQSQEFRQLLLNWGLWDIKHEGNFLSWAGRRNNSWCSADWIDL